VLRGGEWPDIESIPAGVPYREDNHVPPGLPEENDRLKDDPANVYEEDEVDAAI